MCTHNVLVPPIKRASSEVSTITGEDATMLFIVLHTSTDSYKCIHMWMTILL